MTPTSDPRARGALTAEQLLVQELVTRIIGDPRYAVVTISVEALLFFGQTSAFKGEVLLDTPAGTTESRYLDTALPVSFSTLQGAVVQRQLEGTTFSCF